MDKDSYDFPCYNSNCQKRAFDYSGGKQCHNASVHRNSNKKEDATYCEDCKSVFPTFADATDHASTIHGEGGSVKAKGKGKEGKEKEKEKVKVKGKGKGKA